MSTPNRDNYERILARDIMKVIIYCKSPEELNAYLLSLRERISELSPRECIGALRSSYAASPYCDQWQPLYEAAKQHLGKTYEQKLIDDWFINLDKPYVRSRF